MLLIDTLAGGAGWNGSVNVALYWGNDCVDIFGISVDNVPLKAGKGSCSILLVFAGRSGRLIANAGRRERTLFSARCGGLVTRFAARLRLCLIDAKLMLNARGSCTQRCVS